MEGIFLHFLFIVRACYYEYELIRLDNNNKKKSLYVCAPYLKVINSSTCGGGSFGRTQYNTVRTHRTYLTS